MSPKIVLVLGANGYIGDAVARGFVRAGWTTFGLVRSSSSAPALTLANVTPIVGDIDDLSTHDSAILAHLPGEIDVIVTTTHSRSDYTSHFESMLTLCRAIAERTSERPLLIFTSGCKDYGVGVHFANDPGVAPHTETYPLNPSASLAPRCAAGLKILEQKSWCVPVTVRPPNLYGGSSSFYSFFFGAAAAIAPGEPLVVADVRRDSICHAMHADDCADAYVALAEAPRADVEGQAFNIASERYETAEEVAEALAKAYGLAGVKWAETGDANAAGLKLLLGAAQWVGSEKLRKLTGWTDKKERFSDAIPVYRAEYEAARKAGDERVLKMDVLIKSIQAARFGKSA